MTTNYFGVDGYKRLFGYGYLFFSVRVYLTKKQQKGKIFIKDLNVVGETGYITMPETKVEEFNDVYMEDFYNLLVG